MKKNRRSCVTFILLAGGVFGLLLIAGLIYYFYNNFGPNKPVTPLGPTILVTSPTSDQADIPVEALIVEATAMGDAPVGRLELWLDGELHSDILSESPEGVEIFTGTFNLPLTKGSHMLFVRAVDTNNLIGQSFPIFATGAFSMTAEGPVILADTNGASAEEVAAANGTDVATLLSANPDFGASDTVAIPIPQQQGPQPGDNSTPGGVNTQNVPPANVIQHYPLGIPAFAPTISIQSLLKLIPPAAPTNLNVQLANCTINLSWQDNAVNELGYNVWMTGFNMAPRIIAALDKIPGTGPTWVELAVPKPGEFSVWVEAVSALGGQPSNFQWLSVTSACPSQLPGKLLVEALDFTANSFYDRAYCYISFEGDPETRVPREKSQFVAVANGQGDIAPWASGDKKFVMSIPVDNALALEGECWGWAGNALSEIGRFSATSTPAEWDGRRLVSGENLEIVYRVTMGSPQEVTFADNPSILRPYDLKDLQVGYWPDIRDTREQEQQMNLDQRLIEWKWDGDPKTINGFIILLNGVPYYRTNDPDSRSALLHLPGFCGTAVKWEVVATADDSQSLPSDPFISDKYPCSLYMMVDFKRVDFYWTNDSWHNRNQGCDELQIKSGIDVNGYVERYPAWNSPPQIAYRKTFNGGGFYRTVRCGSYSFDEIAGSTYTQKDPNATSFIIPVNSESSYRIGANLWDMDETNDPDRVATLGSYYWLPQSKIEELLENAPTIPEGMDVTSNDYKKDNFECWSQYDTFPGNAASEVFVCLYFFKEDPRTGLTTVPGESSGRGQTDNTPNLPVLKTKQNAKADIGIVDLYVDNMGLLRMRVTNNGPDAVYDEYLATIINVISDDPKVNDYIDNVHNINGISLSPGQISDIDLLKTYVLDSINYNYDFTVSIQPFRNFQDDKTGNNLINKNINTQSQPLKPLEADLDIMDYFVDQYNQLHFLARNEGPDDLNDESVEFTCSLNEILRSTGKTSDRKDVSETLTYYNEFQLSNGEFIEKYTFLKVDLSRYWYEVTCLAKPLSFNDRNLTNNKLVKIIH